MIQSIPPCSSAISITTAPLFNGLYQLGFITANLDAAQSHLARRFGINQFRVRHDGARGSTAHAYAGDMMIEVISPGPEASPVYLEALPSGDGVRLHHMGHMVPDLEKWQEIEAIVAREGWDTPLRGAVMEGHLRYLYIDTRADLGYYQEYVCLTGPARHIYDDVPAN